MSSIWRNLMRRRVLQIVGIYLGAVFALLEFTNMIVERYALSDNLIDMVLAGMLRYPSSADRLKPGHTPHFTV